MSMIPKELVGKWWAFKAKNPFSYPVKDKLVTCIYRGNEPPIGHGQLVRIGRNSITSWCDTTCLDKMLFMGKYDKVDCSAINFPPDEYLDEGITEFEILPNGDYLIFDTITFNNYNYNGTEQSV